jgi:hypothetical protein
MGRMEPKEKKNVDEDDLPRTFDQTAITKQKSSWKEAGG